MRIKCDLMADRGYPTMNLGHPINDYITSLKAARALDGQVVYHREFEPSEPVFGEPREPWPEPIRHLLGAMGIDRLYAHQVRTIDRVRAGIHTVAATRTASGKTLTYALPVFESVIKDASTCALFIYPLKALAQDQCKAIMGMSAHLPDLHLRAQIYDGDTSAYRRKKYVTRRPMC
jgi:DEAD/DEAH box helicase domain-containing protein